VKTLALGTARNCQIAIEEVVEFGATATASAITYLNNGYSKFEHTRLAGLGTRTAMNADKIIKHLIFISVFIW
jgi:hypothetical protein